MTLLKYSTPTGTMGQHEGDSRNDDEAFQDGALKDARFINFRSF